MPSAPNRNPLTRNDRGMQSIDEFLRVRDYYNGLPGKIVDGKMMVLFNGEWLTRKELNKFFRKPILPDFTANLNNSDTTKLWMYQ